MGPELTFQVGFEPIIHEFMSLKDGSFGDDEDEVSRFIEQG